MHPPSRPAAGPLERWVATARRGSRERHAAAFAAAGADDVADRDRAARRHAVRGPAARARRAPAAGRARRPRLGRDPARDAPPTGARSSPPPAADDRRRAREQPLFGGRRRDRLRRDAPRDVPDLPADNALPRWLAEVAGYRSTTCAGAGGSRSTRLTARPRAARRARRRWRLRSTSADVEPVASWLGVRAVAARPRAPSSSSPGGPPRDAGLARATSRRSGRGRWSRSAGCARRPALADGGADAADAAAILLGALLERDGPGVARATLLAPARRRGARRHAGSCSPTGSAPTRRRWPGRRGPVRVGPAAARARRATRGCASSPRRPRRRRSRSCSAATRWSGPGVRLVLGRPRRAAMDATPGLRRDPAAGPRAVGEDAASSPGSATRSSATAR